MGWVIDAGILLLLAIVAWSISHQYLGDSLFVWGDHPGQFMRFWYPLAHAIPQSGHWLWGITSWNPTWYAGYPELQFYPPGTTLLGITLYYLTLGQLSPEQVYNLIPAIALCLPLFSCYAFLRITLAPLGRLSSSLGGIVAGLLAVAFKPMWGGNDAVIIGLMGERLAFAFAPLILLAGWWLVEKPSAKSLAMASLLLAFLLLLHPFHAPALVLAVTLYALIRLFWQSQRIQLPRLSQFGSVVLWLAGWLLLSVGLVTWWVVPLLAHYTPYAAALLRATPEQVVSWFDASYVEWLRLAAVAALPLLAHRHLRVRSTVGVLALLIPLIIAGILFNDRVLFARLDITVLDPIRFIAEYYLAHILLVGCAVAAVTSPFLWRLPWLALVCLSLLLLPASKIIPDARKDLSARVSVPPAFHLNGMLQHPAFNGYWEALRNDPASGRIFFVDNYVFLDASDGTVTPTTVNSITPYLTGREIIGGTFSHWSPVARWLWVGDSRAELLPAQVEGGGAKLVFGKPWQEIPADELAANLQRLNVGTVVVAVNDEEARQHLDASPHFTYYWGNEYFNMYHLIATEEGWLTANGATAHLVERTPLQWLIGVAESAANATLTLKMAHYPLWHAQANGQELPIQADAFGLQTIKLPPGGPYTLEATYEEGIPEWSGLFLSILSLLIVLWLLIPKRRLQGTSPSRTL